MESLAYLAITILLIQALMVLAAVIFSSVFRKSKKFKITSIVFIVLFG